ncbi:MAG: hypothetical protein D6775_02365 [Caldilineae bacterium]|nr:MAG: hypothetical protein D6775_02365 [Caldilineae bacterium]
MFEETEATLRRQLNDFDPAVRARALAKLKTRADVGLIKLAPEREVANMHCHTFFSFNAYGYSPTGLAWVAKEHGYKLMGIVDFDVLDGVDEWLQACTLVELRGSAGIETRAYVPEFADKVINSPGEPGITYHMGIGFTSGTIPDSVADIARSLRERARKRNLAILEKVNAYLDPVTIDYERDVLPLTPGGNATERHMVRAYLTAADRLLPNPARFWSEKLDLPLPEVLALMGTTGDAPPIQNAIRKKLMKRGGVGYVQPDSGSFPTIEEFHRFVVACGALPCVAWLDGLSEGEQQMEALLDLLVGKGAAALNIIPERNWNIVNPEVREQKVARLYEIVELAARYHLPLNIGTEMNSFGQPHIDAFDEPVLQPLVPAFLDGAYFIYGHTMLQRHAGLGYQSEWAQMHLPERAERNEFYTRAGRAIPPGQPGITLLSGLDDTYTPDRVLDHLSDADAPE